MLQTGRLTFRPTQTKDSRIVRVAADKHFMLRTDSTQFLRNHNTDSCTAPGEIGEDKIG